MGCSGQLFMPYWEGYFGGNKQQYNPNMSTYSISYMTWRDHKGWWKIEPTHIDIMPQLFFLYSNDDSTIHFATLVMTSQLTWQLWCTGEKN